MTHKHDDGCPGVGKCWGDVHYTNEEYNTDADLLLPGKSKLPDGGLGEEDGEDIEYEVGDGGGESKGGNLEAAERVGEERIPVPLKGCAVGHVHGEEDDGEAGDDHGSRVAGPGEHVFAGFGDEDCRPLQQDGDLDEGDEDEVEEGRNPADLPYFVSDIAPLGGGGPIPSGMGNSRRRTR